MLRLPPSVKSRLRKRPGARNDQDAADFEAFVQMAAPGLYLSTAVAAELRARTIQARDIRTLEKIVLKPYYKRARIVNPSAAAWDALGKTLAWMVRNDGIDLRTIRRSFIFDILLAYSDRELGAVLISGNEQDLNRIRRVFSAVSYDGANDFSWNRVGTID